MISVTIFNEFIHEREDEHVRSLYPHGIHATIASFLEKEPDVTVTTATLDELEHGLSANVLHNSDVLLWWGHKAHKDVSDDVVERVHRRVLAGMGLVVLHSGHYSKIFKRLMGTTCSLLWREMGEKERIWVVNPSHPITRDIGPYIELPQTEMYGEFFDVPQPDELIFVSWFAGGEVFRSGMTWRRGRGRIFYFRPGHETYPIYHDASVQKVLSNAVHWAAFRGNTAAPGIGEGINVIQPLERIT